MPEGRDPDDMVGGGGPKMSFSQRLLLSLPRFKRSDKPSVGDRFKNAVLKPEAPEVAAAKVAAAKSATLEELEDDNRYANDKERLVGLLGAPVGGAVGLLIINDLISHDPAARTSTGAVNRLHVSISLYHELEVVLLVLSVLMLVTGWTRKRLYLGMVMALYGLAVFNLHYWGFGIPFLMAGAWLLVRAYRSQQAVKAAGGTTSRARPEGRPGPTTAGPRPTKRYGAPPPKWSSPPKPPSSS